MGTYLSMIIWVTENCVHAACQRNPQPITKVSVGLSVMQLTRTPITKRSSAERSYGGWKHWPITRPRNREQASVTCRHHLPQPQLWGGSWFPSGAIVVVVVVVVVVFLFFFFTLWCCNSWVLPASTQQAIRRKWLELLRQSASSLQLNARLHTTNGNGTALPYSHSRARLYPSLRTP
jgi:hypothetical protein